MWIRPVGDPKAKWKRIKYHDWLATPIANRPFYETKPEPLPTQAQKLAMLKGRIIRHTLATQAQARLALDYIRELKKITEQQQLSGACLAVIESKMCDAYNASGSVHVQIIVDTKQREEAKQSSPSNLS